MSRRKKGLSADDRAVWESVAKQVTPLHPKTEPMIDRPLPMPKKAEPKAEFAPFKIGEKTKTKDSVSRSAPLTDALRQAPLQMDNKAYSKMSRGKLKPEARIDLHGMTLDEAYPALQDFILGAWKRGLRLVLVITGKGKSKDTGGPIPVRKGILRHSVPQWLRLTPLGPLVLEVRPAHVRHGGEGAFYVYLRRRR